MPFEPPKGPAKAAPTLQSLADEWERAQVKFRELREAVEHASRLAELTAQRETLMKERDVALKSLGEAFWNLIQTKELPAPRALGTRLRALEDLERRRSAQAAEISALLAEGEEAAVRKQQKKAQPVQSPLARPPKKR